MRRLFGVHRYVLVAVATLACGTDEIVSGVSDSTFVATLADLQRIRSDPSLDSAAREESRRRILQGRGLTAEQLEQAATALAEDPRRARELLQAVRVKLLPGDDADAAAPDTSHRAPDRPAP
ncbi:MAG TPA: hypothetical protein VFZ11_12090 [Gemmatimonadaceae bacterium]